MKTTLPPQCAPVKQGGFEPIPGFVEPCLDPSHKPPTHLVIPRGQQYRHVCPTCGAEVVMRGSTVTC